MKKIFKIAFVAISIVTVLEYLLVFGTFTGPGVMALVCILGLINLVFSLQEKNYNEALLYLIASVGLSMGYWKVMF